MSELRAKVSAMSDEELKGLSMGEFNRLIAEHDELYWQIKELKAKLNELEARRHELTNLVTLDCFKEDELRGREIMATA